MYHKPDVANREIKMKTLVKSTIPLSYDNATYGSSFYEFVVFISSALKTSDDKTRCFVKKI